jgi:GT2 family glycosyltransferase
MKPLLSLVVLSFRNFDATTGVCLDSLQPWLDDPAVEVLVVDNGSDDGSAEKTADWCARHPSVTCHMSETNRGFAEGMNYGVTKACGEWVVLVNNDTVFPERTIDALKRVIGALPSDVAMLGPVTNVAGNGQRLWRPEATTAQWLEVGRWLNDHPSHQLMPVYRCDFFCIAIRRDVWNELGGLDPVFGLGYYEDFDFSLRLRLAGYRQLITEDVFVLHLGSATFKTNNSAKVLMKRNKKLLRTKHRDARFEHTRLGNLAVLRAYKEIQAAGNWTPALEARRQLRIGALDGDAPRSMLKKWLWKKKVAEFRNQSTSGSPQSPS